MWIESTEFEKKKAPIWNFNFNQVQNKFVTFLFFVFFCFSFFFSSLPPLTPQRRRRTNGVGHLRREAAPAVGKVGHGDAARRATRWREKFFFLDTSCVRDVPTWCTCTVGTGEMASLEPHPVAVQELQECTKLRDCLCVSDAAKPLEIQIWQIFNDNNENWVKHLSVQKLFSHYCIFNYKCWPVSVQFYFQISARQQFALTDL